MKIKALILRLCRSAPNPQSPGQFSVSPDGSGDCGWAFGTAGRLCPKQLPLRPRGSSVLDDKFYRQVTIMGLFLCFVATFLPHLLTPASSFTSECFFFSWPRHRLLQFSDALLRRHKDSEPTSPPVADTSLAIGCLIGHYCWDWPWL